MTKLISSSDNLYGTDFTELKNYLAACNAYEEPSQAKLQQSTVQYINKFKI